MKSKKLFTLSVLLAALAVFQAAAPTYGQESFWSWLFGSQQSDSSARTERYLQQVAGILAELKESFDESEDVADPVGVVRRAAAALRAIPKEGVDMEAVQLTWRTANFCDRLADWGERVQRLQAGAFLGGAAVGELLASEEPAANLLGLGLGILGILLGYDECSRIAAEQKQLETLSVKLGEDWNSYLQRWKARQRRPDISNAILVR